MEENNGSVDGRVLAQQLNVGRVTDGQLTALRATRDGSVIVLPWFQALVLEGRVYEAIAPETLTTLTTGLLVGADLGDAANDLFVDVPDGLALIPIEVLLATQVTSPTISAAVPIKFWAFLSDTLNGTGGTETACTIRSLNRAAPSPSGATAAHTASGEVDHVTGAEVHLFKDVTEFDIDGTVGFENNRWWSVLSSVAGGSPRRHTGKNGQQSSHASVAPIGVDGASLNIIVQTADADNTTTAWAQAIWAEISENLIT